MSRYQRRPLTVFEELQQLLDGVRAERRARNYEADRAAAERRLEDGIARLAAKGLTWSDIAERLDTTVEDAKARFTPAVRRACGTNRLTRWGPKSAEPYTVVIAHRITDAAEVRAWVNPSDEAWTEIGTGGWVIREKLPDVLAADLEELAEVVTERLGIQPNLNAFELERALRSVTALATTLGLPVGVDWWLPTAAELREGHESSTLASLVEAVYEAFGPDVGDAQADALGFRVSRRRPRPA